MTFFGEKTMRSWKSTQFVVYPGQSHGIRPPSYQKDRYQRYLDWYQKWVKNPSRAATDGGTGPPSSPEVGGGRNQDD